MANEGLEAHKKEDEVAAEKRKAEDDKAWEGMHLFDYQHLQHHSLITERREERVDTWRAFANNNTRKKKKQKVAVLG